MGTLWDNSLVEKEDVESKITKINELTKNCTILEFIGIYLEFSIKEENVFSKKIIKVKAKKFNVNLQKVNDDHKTFHLTLEDFYNYYNALMNSLNIIVRKKIGERMSTLTEEEIETFGSDESSLCPICEENKVDISLPCSHFFCENCIKSWVIKSETCPLCRLKLEYNKQNENSTPAGIKSSKRWSVISYDENDKQEMKKDSIDVLLKLTHEFFDVK